MTRENRMLIVFDMDGVLTQHSSSWRYVHERIGVNNSANYDLFRNRKLSYDEFLRSDVELWNEKLGKVRKDDVVSILNDIPLRDNLREAMERLRSHGAVMAIVSGGISWLSDRINDVFRFDYTFANSLITDGEGVIQPAGTTMVDPLRKDLSLKKIQDELEVDASRTVSVGDSLQDVAMFRLSGFSVGFNPMEDEVQEHCSVCLRSNDMEDLAKLIEQRCLKSS